jgi:hypothetical protein
LAAKVSRLFADKNNMKRFFQGLVLGAALMYGYLYHGAYLLGQLQYWLNYSASQYRDDRWHVEAEKALHGLLLQRGLQYPVESENAFG